MDGPNSEAALRLSEEVAQALADGRPLVALESTLIAHGFPAPENRALADDLEAAVRRRGAVPATVAVIDGAVRVGLSAEALDRLAAGPARKCSVRDLGPALAGGALGATTVAATLRLAHRAGLEVFATGGVGGVHRRLPGGLARAADISADLIELSRTPIIVVCAGAKAILDLPATVEALESLGVPVVGYRTGEFPAFFCAESGLGLGDRVDTAEAAAGIYRAQRRLGLEAALLVCQAPPREAALDRAAVEGWLATAEERACEAGVAGPGLTPFLLEALAELSGGRSLAVNRALAVANAELAAEVAVALRGGPAP